MFLGSILLDNNRWKDTRNPLFRLDEDWAARIAAAGFSGIELWEPHYFEAPAEPRAVLPSLICPVRIFNTYTAFAEAGGEDLDRLAEAVRAFSGTLIGVKFNFGKDRSTLKSELAALGRFTALLPKGVKLLCECHEGTSVEEPEAAAEVFEQLPEERFGAIVHPFTAPRLEDWFRLLGPRIAHLHIQARAGDGAWLAPRPGSAGVDDGLARLEAAGFSGTATLEFTRGITDGLSPAELLAQAAGDRAALAPRLSLRA